MADDRTPQNPEETDEIGRATDEDVNEDEVEDADDEEGDEDEDVEKGQ